MVAQRGLFRCAFEFFLQQPKFPAPIGQRETEPFDVWASAPKRGLDFRDLAGATDDSCARLRRLVDVGALHLERFVKFANFAQDLVMLRL
jgi:hypothetical protein